MKRTLIAALLGLFAASVYSQTSSPQPSASQTPAQPSPQNGVQPTRDANGVYTITRNARIVILDMVVTDAKGNVVTDLKKDDFHVTESDEPQTILNFEPAGVHTTPPSASIDSTAALDALAPRAPVNIVLLDEFNTHFEDMAFAR